VTYASARITINLGNLGKASQQTPGQKSDFRRNRGDFHAIFIIQQESVPPGGSTNFLKSIWHETDACHAVRDAGWSIGPTGGESTDIWI